MAMEQSCPVCTLQWHSHKSTPEVTEHGATHTLSPHQLLVLTLPCNYVRCNHYEKLVRGTLTLSVLHLQLPVALY